MVHLSDRFYGALASRESRGKSWIVNSLGFMGLYQMGPAALQDTGYMDYRGNWTGWREMWKQEDFLNNPVEQLVACRAFHDRLWNNIPQNVRGRVGSTVGGIHITQAGLIAGGHLLGEGGVTQFINSGGATDLRDPYGTPISEYIREFGQY